MCKKHSFLAIAIAVFGFSLVLHGCNAFESFDEPETEEETLIGAQALMDAGDCAGASTLMKSKAYTSDIYYRTLGWALLCEGGASLSKVLATLLSFSSSSNNLNIVGALANKLIPQTDTKIAKFDEALDFFGRQSASNDKYVNVALASISKAAAIVSLSSSNLSTVSKADISVGACTTAVCGTDPSPCVAAGSGNMSTNDTVRLREAITGAQTALSSAGSSLGSLTDLSSSLTTLIGPAAAATLIRCVVVNNMLSQ